MHQNGGYEHDTAGGFDPLRQPPKLRIGKTVDGVFILLQKAEESKLDVIPEPIKADMRKYRYCREEKCRAEWPTYGYEYKHPTHCMSCKKPGMKNVMNNTNLKRLCHGDPETGDPCDTRASYGVGKIKVHCSQHYRKLEIMNDAGKSKIAIFNERGFPICQEAGCHAEWPTHGKIDKYPIYCKPDGEKHGMKNVMHCECHGDPKNGIICPVKNTCYGIPRKSRTHCASCGTKHGMENVIAPLCPYVINKITGETCGKCASYGPNGEYASHCSPHGIELGMETVRSTCPHVDHGATEPCGKFLCYGLEGQSATHCAQHGSKIKDMVDVVSSRCLSGRINITTGKTCVVRPCYGFKGGSATHCATCGGLETGMENVYHPRCLSGRIDITTNKPCIKQPYYGRVGESPTHCTTCGKLEKDMEDVVHRKCVSGCIDIATNKPCVKRVCYGFKGGSATHCAPCGHKIKDMVNVISPRCLICDTIYSGSTKKKFKGYCFPCFREKHPNELPVYNHNTKENAVGDFLKKVLLSQKVISIIYNKRIYCGNCYYQPDILIRCVGFIIIVEIDERQHRSYDPDEEKKRMQDIAASLGCDSVVFIRFNPDSYSKDGTYFPSCWKEDGNGILKVDNELAWNERLITLQKLIQQYLDNKVLGCKYEYLYYDKSIEGEDESA